MGERHEGGVLFVTASFCRIPILSGNRLLATASFCRIPILSGNGLTASSFFIPSTSRQQALSRIETGFDITTCFIHSHGHEEEISTAGTFISFVRSFVSSCETKLQPKTTEHDLKTLTIDIERIRLHFLPIQFAFCQRLNIVTYHRQVTILLH